MNTLLRVILSRAPFGGFSPIQNFAAGEQGAWYDPSDLSTLFQDDAGTTPVTADGQFVGLMLDKSGRGNHASQSLSGSKPLYKTSVGLHWLEFAADDFLVTPTIDFTATDKMSVVLGVRKNTDGSAQTVLELSATTSGANVGSFGIFAPSAGASASYDVMVRGSTSRCEVRATSFAAPITNVVAVNCDISGATASDEISVRVNGATPTMLTTAAGPAGGGTFGNYPIYIGRRGGTSLSWAGRFFGGIVRGAASTTPEVVSNETWMNIKTAAY